MNNREHHIIKGTPQDHHDLVMAIGHMSIAFGRLEDMLKILQARADGVDIDMFIKGCGLNKKTAHKILKNLSKHYDASVIAQVQDLFKIRNDFLHATYTSDDNGNYVRVREGEPNRDRDADIKTLDDIATQANAIIPQLAVLQPVENATSQNTTINGTYKHYKGNLYEVIGVALDTATQGKVVLYHGLYDLPDLQEEYGDNPIFTRPYDEFFSDIELDGKIVPRFMLVESKK